MNIANSIILNNNIIFYIANSITIDHRIVYSIINGTSNGAL